MQDWQASHWYYTIRLLQGLLFYTHPARQPSCPSCPVLVSVCCSSCHWVLQAHPVILINQRVSCTTQHRHRQRHRGVNHTAVLSQEHADQTPTHLAMPAHVSTLTSLLQHACWLASVLAAPEAPVTAATLCQCLCSSCVSTVQQLVIILHAHLGVGSPPPQLPSLPLLLSA